MQPNFWCGLSYGLIAALIIAAISNKIHEAQTKIGKQYRHLNSFSDAEQPKLTPVGIVRGSLLGMLGCAGWVIVLIVIGYFLWQGAIVINTISQ